MIKLRINQEQLETIIDEVIKNLNESYKSIKARDVFGEFINRGYMVEGLIKTYSPQDTVKCLYNKGIRKFEIYPFILWNMQDNKEKQYQIQLLFKEGLNDGIDIDEIIHNMDVFGWFFAHLSIDGKIYKVIDKELKNRLKNTIFTLLFEPKFDLLVDPDNIPEYMYHITKKKYVEKILKQGLKPAAKNKVNITPERIYLFRDYPNNWKRIADFFNETEDTNDDYCLLKIDSKFLNKGNNIYYDPNSNYITAYYTLEPISPIAIKVQE